MQIANPVLTSVINDDKGETEYKGKWSEYQIIDDVDINGSVTFIFLCNLAP